MDREKEAEVEREVRSLSLGTPYKRFLARNRFNIPVFGICAMVLGGASLLIYDALLLLVSPEALARGTYGHIGFELLLAAAAAPFCFWLALVGRDAVLQWLFGGASVLFAVNVALWWQLWRGVVPSHSRSVAAATLCWFSAVVIAVYRFARREGLV